MYERLQKCKRLLCTKDFRSTKDLSGYKSFKNTKEYMKKLLTIKCEEFFVCSFDPSSGQKPKSQAVRYRHITTYAA